MPNWAEGTLKLRGKWEDIQRYLREQLVWVTWTLGKLGGEDTSTEREVEYEFEDETILMEEPRNAWNTDTRDCIWVRDTHRNFIDFDESYYGLAGYSYTDRDGKVEIPAHFFGDKNQKDAEAVAVLPFKAAWSVHEEDQEHYRKMSEEYHLGIRTYVIESGWGFVQRCTWRNGVEEENVVVPDGDKGFGDARYSEFIWECPFPGIGG